MDDEQCQQSTTDVSGSLDGLHLGHTSPVVMHVEQTETKAVDNEEYQGFSKKRKKSWNWYTY